MSRLLAIATKHGLIGWYKYGILPSRKVSVSRMLEVAGGITGKQYKRGDSEKAAKDLEVWLTNNPIVER